MSVIWIYVLFCYVLMSGCVYVYNQLTYTTENERKMVIDISQSKKLTFEGIFYGLFCSEDLTWSDSCVKFTWNSHTVFIVLWTSLSICYVKMKLWRPNLTHVVTQKWKQRFQETIAEGWRLNFIHTYKWKLWFMKMVFVNLDSCIEMVWYLWI
jgi:hypothetical protein